MASALTSTGSTRRWRRTRALVLAEEPVCRWCRSSPSTEVDHIIPRARGGTDARENLTGACRPCNLARAAQLTISRTATPSRRW